MNTLRASGSAHRLDIPPQRSHVNVLFNNRFEGAHP